MRCYSHAASAVSAAAVLGLLLSATPAAAACDPDNALFADDFEFMDGSWGVADDKIFVEDGVFAIKGPWGRINFQTTNEAADLCVDATIAKAADPDDTAAWVIFWWQDWDNYYCVGYWGNGVVQVTRRVKGKWVTVAYLESVPALKAGVGQTNSLELKMTPKDATVLVNGTQVTRIKGKPPKDGGPIGFMASEPEGKPAMVTFDNLVVSEPAE